MDPLIADVNRMHQKESVPEFEPGDTVDVHVRIVEGEKERIQVFTGTVLARRGEGINSYFTVRHLFAGEGVERMFPLHSPRIEKIEVKRRGRTRRAKLYYLRDRVGKGAVLREENRKRALRNRAAPQAQGRRRKKKKKK
jgi:large subunit ribosomal protein L19